MRPALASTLLLAMAAALPVAAAERRVIGLTQDGSQEIVALVVHPEAEGAGGLLLIGGMRGEDESSETVRALVADIESNPDNTARLLAIPVANPAAAELAFPPPGTAYRENSESHALWRWIGLHAPAMVVIVGEEAGGLAAALANNEVAGMGRIPARVFPANLSGLSTSVSESEAHRELERRRSRTPEELAAELAVVYGHDFNQLTYLPGMALIGQLRLGNVEEVARLAEPYLDSGRDLLARASSLTLAGHLVFAELAEKAPDSPQAARYRELVRNVAELGFDANGQMHESMPYHNEMSDSYFMAGPIVTKAGKFTGERRYFDLVARHIRYLQGLTLRPDGLHRHSPLTEAAWGRGNAFAALGLALTLSDFPEDHPDYAFILDSFHRHMAALAGFQDPDGMWHNVIDVPGSYAETSATSMIATAMLRGIRRGWLNAAEYQPRVDRAWRGVLARVGSDGELVDVCESTNKQPSLEDYLHRAAILGQDTRGGGMALLFATEMAGLE